MTITSMTNNRSLLKYFFVLLILFISAAILSTNEGTRHTKLNYFLESRTPKITKNLIFLRSKISKKEKTLL